MCHKYRIFFFVWGGMKKHTFAGAGKHPHQGTDCDDSIEDKQREQRGDMQERCDFENTERPNGPSKVNIRARTLQIIPAGDAGVPPVGSERIVSASAPRADGCRRYDNLAPS